MPGAADILQTPFSRVFLIEDGASPANVPQYLGLAAAMANTWKQGTLTPIRIPSPESYGTFDTVDILRGAQDLPQLTIQQRMQPSLSDLLRIVRKGCPVDVHVHIGACQNPSDFDNGWTLARVLELAKASDYSTSNIGAMDADQNAVVTETVPFSGRNMFDLKRIRPGEVAGVQVTDFVPRVLICDSKTCGACGLSSDGCQVMFAAAGAVAGSPGISAEVNYTVDGGTTWAQSIVTSMIVGEAIVDMACVGTNLVVLSATGTTSNFHYAPLADVVKGTAIWTKVSTGFVATKTGNRIVSLDASHTWVAANGGYAYFSADITAGVVVQDAGVATAQNLTALAIWDKNNVIMVGATNVVIATSSGGAAWTLVTGPSVGNALTAAWMLSATLWLVAGNGSLYYTVNNGLSWVVKAFAGSGSGTVRDIQFSSPSVGYMAHDTAGLRGRVFRTINGGYSWTLMPEETSVPLPTVVSIRTIAACTDDPNLAVVGGVNANGSDGYLAVYQ